ncbi:MAG TPA: M20 family metallopeptidase [Bacteroidales bacterium]|jgi:amidohydrolase|nr:M20 family metallopeptidase [Bacteroidales bacterium]HOL97957.1 M20 family metallopeptidase [Bacteroidales bacterium]HOM36368.1 M20 family metallopeptidase [Bacteroidales bacterium]HPD23535.1 M20 family metallopeptidase [Bacteroidales bacterium]HRS99159.1 M20 family metallopeptidase [Bacteroidales bacterium]
MQDLKSKIKEKSASILSEIISYRRHIHKNPELAFEEFDTAAYISEVLMKHNIETDDSFGKNAVIGIINGIKETPVIALRADIDALPINEANDAEYKSKVAGKMHACGHDAHTASLLGTSIILNELKSQIRGKIILIFQPAEEKIPGGAKILVEKGIIEKYDIRHVIGQHVLPELETGSFAFGYGEMMAATDELYISFTGIGGHAALPHKRSDTVLSLANFLYEINEFQKSIISDKPFVIAFGKINAPGALNAIPSEAFAEGTMRTFNEELRKRLKEKLNEIAEKSAEMYNCKARVNIREGYPAVYNNPDLYHKVLPFAIDFAGEQKIKPMEVRMTAEDFAYYGQKVPSLFYRTGIAGNNKGYIGLHNPNFDIDEKSLEHSAGMMAYIAINLLDYV